MTTKIICAWCKEEMGEEEIGEGGITHSICPKCSEEQNKIIQKPKKRETKTAQK